MSKSVLLIIESMGAGSGRVALRLARGLAGRGWRVGLAYGTRMMDAAVREDMEMLPDRVDRVEFDLARIPGAGWARTIATLVAWCGADRSVVVHGHSTYGGILARICGALARQPCVYTPHAFKFLDPDLGRFQAQAAIGVERSLTRLTARILCVSRSEASAAAAIGFPVGKLEVVPNGIPRTPSWDSSRAGRAEHGLVRLSWVGRFSPQKGLDLLVRSVAALPAARRERLQVTIAGYGPEGERCRRLAREMGVDGQLQWLGERPGVDVIRESDALLCTSRYEGFPLTFLEAMDAGRPIVSTPVQGTCGLTPAMSRIAAATDPAAIAAAISEFMDADIGAAQAASRRLVRCYSLERMLDRHEAVYRSVARDRIAGSVEMRG